MVSEFSSQLGVNITKSLDLSPLQRGQQRWEVKPKELKTMHSGIKRLYSEGSPMFKICFFPLMDSFHVNPTSHNLHPSSALAEMPLSWTSVNLYQINLGKDTSCSPPINDKMIVGILSKHSWKNKGLGSELASCCTTEPVLARCQLSHGRGSSLVALQIKMQ